MDPARPLRVLATLAAALALLAAPAARAGCSRLIQMPMYASGTLTKAVGNEVGGFLPDLMRKFGAQYGCDYVWSIVPRARLEAMFEAGQADILLGATRTPRRDQFGYFIPMLTTRATLVSLKPPVPPVHSIAELLARRELKVALVRGQDYGPEFMAMSNELANQKRLVLESVNNVARLLEMGAVDVTVLTPTVLAAALGGDPRTEGLIDKMDIEPLAELGWNESGAYISKSSVTPSDRVVIEQMLTAIAKSNLINEVLKQQFPPHVINGSSKQR